MNKKIFFILGAILIIGILFLSNRFSQNTVPQNFNFQVVTSFYPLYFFTQQIAGAKADVINITPAGAEPHDYEPTARDITQIENSKMVILNGGGLETWGNDIQKNINPQNTIIVTVGDNLTNGIDPHIWLSPVLAKSIVDKIAQGFFQIDQKNKNYYQANADALKKKLDDLDKQYQRGLSNCANKNIIVSHTAFSYLAAAYGLNQISIAGLSPDAEPSQNQLAGIIKFAKANNIKYIFFESLVSPKLSNTIATEIGAKTLALNPIEGLSDQELSQGKNYFTEMTTNLTNLKIALQCQ